MKEMIKKENLRKKLPEKPLTDELEEIRKEDKEIYLFLRGGFGAK